ncbi:MAG: DUF3048 domain-containing protein [Lachnospiraceae bacterium]|nr:DUF3048 domain-containing protein [Lachnospiraceae bacterium]
MKGKLNILLAVLIFAFCLAGCGNEEEPVENRINVDVQQEVEETVEEPTTEEEVVVEDVIPEGMYRSELTNELISEELKNQRPIAVMVDNEKTALPHFGISQADVVYELMNSTKNDRITRLMVLVKDWGSIEQLGSIRSLRPTNILLAVEWNAVICHDGGPFYNDPYLEPDYVENFSGTFSRVKNGKPYEFTEYILPGDLEKNFASKGYSTEYNEYYPGPHYQFATEANPVNLSDEDGAIAADKVIFPFKHNGSYLEYDEESGLYKYFEYGSAHVDAGNNNVQTTFKNVLIQKCTFHQYDENGYLIFNCIAEAEEGYYLTNGKAIPVTWTKRGDPEISITRYYDAEGNEITLNTGKTYIAFVPDDNWSQLVIQ